MPCSVLDVAGGEVFVVQSRPALEVHDLLPVPGAARLSPGELGVDRALRRPAAAPWPAA